jgi:non-heme chloroperoxidase
VAGVVLVSAVPPFMLKTPNNPEGLPIDVFDAIRAGVASENRSQYWKDLSAPFYGANRPGSTVTQGIRDAFWLWSMEAGWPAAYDCIKAFSETDFRPDLAKVDVPTLVIHGDADQIVPIDVGGRRTVTMIKGATLKVYPGAPHGLMSTNQQQFNTDLLEFAHQVSMSPVAS